MLALQRAKDNKGKTDTELQDFEAFAKTELLQADAALQAC